MQCASLEFVLVYRRQSPVNLGGLDAVKLVCVSGGLNIRLQCLCGIVQLELVGSFSNNCATVVVILAGVHWNWLRICVWPPMRVALKSITHLCACTKSAASATVDQQLCLALQRGPRALTEGEDWDTKDPRWNSSSPKHFPPSSRSLDGILVQSREAPRRNCRSERSLARLHWNC